MAGEPTLRRGDTGEWVVYLQQRLEAWGFGSGFPGSFDGDTEAAVWAIQGDIGLPQDGVAGSDTWAFLVDGVRPRSTPPPAPGYGGTARNVDFVGEVEVRGGDVRFAFQNVTGAVLPSHWIANFLVFVDAEGNSVHHQILVQHELAPDQVTTWSERIPPELAPGEYVVHVVLDSGNGPSRTTNAVVSGPASAAIWSEMTVSPEYNPHDASVWYQARNAGPRTAMQNEIVDVVEVSMLGFRRAVPNGVELAPGEHYTVVVHDVRPPEGGDAVGRLFGTVTLHGGQVHPFSFDL